VSEIIAPDAFKDQVGKTVPVWNEDHTRQIGTATVLDADGQMEVTLDETQEGG
jgi:hypothetical protein